jgi:hypothetical protein
MIEVAMDAEICKCKDMSLDNKMIERTEEKIWAVYALKNNSMGIGFLLSPLEAVDEVVSMLPASLIVLVLPLLLTP